MRNLLRDPAAATASSHFALFRINSGPAFQCDYAVAKDSQFAGFKRQGALLCIKVAQNVALS